MKKLIIMAVFAFGIQMQAQVTTPQASPKADFEQVVGLTKVEVEYARPSKKGRLVYGELVPYGKIWRTGANENTIITFSDDVVVDGKTLPKGEYALYTLPKADAWEFIFYNDTKNWGLPAQWDESKVMLRTKVTPVNLSKDVEFFSILVNPIDENNGELILQWERTAVPMKFKVPTHEKAMSSIEKSLNENAKPSDYYAAGQYLYTSGGDLDKALVYIDKCIAMQEETPFYIYRQKSLIQAKLGDKKGAVETAKISMEGAQKAKNEEYVKMNRDAILQWSK